MSKNSTLRQSLNYTPVVLKFGTSGRRGKVIDLTQLEIYLNVSAEIRYLQSLPKDEGGIACGDPFFFAHDLRPSSTQFVSEFGGRGALAQAVQKAVQDCGMIPVNLGTIPTPALAHYALKRKNGSIMVTGSHIPFDRNGYKTYSSIGELLKKDEIPINTCVEQLREELYQSPAEGSLFGPEGLFRNQSYSLIQAIPDAKREYLDRYLNFFPENLLQGKRLLVFQHSAVGRDLLVELLDSLGAEAIPFGRSETFVPIDTEAIEASTLLELQTLVDQIGRKSGTFDGVVSTDGDSDRPLLLGLDSKQRLKFFPGDLLGMVVAAALKADSVTVPVSCNDAIDRSSLAPIVETKTKIGSPFVIDGMQKAQKKGKKTIVGWEANGGFLLASDVAPRFEKGASLSALQTRDAVLPVLSALVTSIETKQSLVEVFNHLPKRFGKSSLIKNFSRELGLKMVNHFSKNGSLTEVTDGPEFTSTKQELSKYFSKSLGFDEIIRLNFLDGVRIIFKNGDVAHFRPSGNADEMRIYALADTQERAEKIADLAVNGPDGILKRLSQAKEIQS